MFSLDNLYIQYPHAEVERVSVSMYHLTPNTISVTIDTNSHESLAIYLCRRSTSRHSDRMGPCHSPRHTQIARHHPRMVHLPHPHPLHHGPRQKRRRKTSSRPHRTMQARTRNTRSPTSHIRSLHRDRSSRTTRWMAQFPIRTQQFCLQRAGLSCLVSGRTMPRLPTTY
jgi:hypothetical protein